MIEEIDELDDNSLEQDEELYEHHSFTADPGQELIRIDKFLMDRMASTSRSRIQYFG